MWFLIVKSIIFNCKLILSRKRDFWHDIKLITYLFHLIIMPKNNWVAWLVFCHINLTNFRVKPDMEPFLTLFLFTHIFEMTHSKPILRVDISNSTGCSRRIWRIWKSRLLFTDPKVDPFYYLRLHYYYLNTKVYT